jgi:nucleotide-binding universal stress UspA family protein
MLPIKTILHPTDFSDCSEAAFELASSLARDYRAKLLVLHVATLPMTVREMGIYVLCRATDPELRERLRQLWPQAPGVFTEHRMVEGDPAREILRVAEETHCEVIVLGTHGRGGLGRLLMGSVAEQVLRKAPCPVVTARTLPLPEGRAGGETSEAAAVHPSAARE